MTCHSHVAPTRDLLSLASPSSSALPPFDVPPSPPSSPSSTHTRGGAIPRMLLLCRSGSRSQDVHASPTVSRSTVLLLLLLLPDTRGKQRGSSRQASRLTRTNCARVCVSVYVCQLLANHARLRKHRRDSHCCLSAITERKMQALTLSPL